MAGIRVDVAVNGGDDSDAAADVLDQAWYWCWAQAQNQKLPG